jgi:hypothetical protein
LRRFWEEHFFWMASSVAWVSTSLASARSAGVALGGDVDHAKGIAASCRKEWTTLRTGGRPAAPEPMQAGL